MEMVEWHFVDNRCLVWSWDGIILIKYTIFVLLTYIFCLWFSEVYENIKSYWFKRLKCIGKGEKLANAKWEGLKCTRKDIDISMILLTLRHLTHFLSNKSYDGEIQSSSKNSIWKLYASNLKGIVRKNLITNIRSEEVLDIKTVIEVQLHNSCKLVATYTRSQH